MQPSRAHPDHQSSCRHPEIEGGKKFTLAHFSHFKQDMGMLLLFPSHSGKKYVCSSDGPRKILAFDIRGMFT